VRLDFSQSGLLTACAANAISFTLSGMANAFSVAMPTVFAQKPKSEFFSKGEPAFDCFPVHGYLFGGENGINA
jgi:hypothetical protein